jgi:hypothetical protein
MSRVCEPDPMVSGSEPRLFYADIEALDQFEPWNEASATARLDRISTQLPVDRSNGLEFVESNNNDVWKIGDLYLRVAWRGDRSRLTREAALMERSRRCGPCSRGRRRWRRQFAVLVNQSSRTGSAPW